MTDIMRGPWSPITPQAIDDGIGKRNPVLVRDNIGNAAAARRHGDMFIYALEDRDHVEQLDFEPTHFNAAARPRPGFVEMAIA